MRRILICSIFVLVFTIMQGVRSDPQAEELLRQCSNFNTTNDLSVFLSNFNKTFGDMRKQLSSAHFATAYYTDVFGMIQCRNYLSIADCLACFDAGLAQIRRDCPQADGAHLIYQGCFLRFDQLSWTTSCVVDCVVDYNLQQYSMIREVTSICWK